MAVLFAEAYMQVVKVALQRREKYEYNELYIFDTSMYILCLMAVINLHNKCYETALFCCSKSLLNLSYNTLNI
jgi:hypothetical protein